MAKKFLRRSTFIILLFAFSITCEAQQDSSAILTQRLDEYLNSAVKVYQFNGAALVAKQGKILLEKGYGWKNAVTKSLNDSATFFPILSMTKSFTATVILKLQEEGKLSVDDHIDKYFPDYKYGNEITIRELLTHTSGIPNYTDIIGPEDSNIVCHPVTRQRVLDVFYTKHLEFKPGKKYRYDNSGYYLLGLIIEKVTGKTYEQVVRETILNPLQMTHSGFDFTRLPDSVRARGYWKLKPDKIIPSCPWDSSVSYSAGEIYSTVSDLYHWANAIAKKQILTPQSWSQAFTPYLENYGYGWWTDTLFGKKYISHTGGGYGYMSHLIYFPEQDITIILLNNFGNYGESLWQITIGLSAITMGKSCPDWREFKAISVDQSTLKKYIGVYSLGKIKVTVTMNDGQLYAEGNSRKSIPKLPIYPLSQNEFFLKNFNVVLEFVSDDRGKITKQVWHGAGNTTELVKVD